MPMELLTVTRTPPQKPTLAGAAHPRGAPLPDMSYLTGTPIPRWRAGACQGCVVTESVVRCAGAIVFDESGRLLLVRRRNEPSRGAWCEPSGRCEPGETPEQACVREAREESGLEVRVIRRLGAVRVPHDEVDYVIEDYLCEVVGGSLEAGDDADEVRWVTRAELADLPLVPDLIDVLQSWDCLPRR